MRMLVLDTALNACSAAVFDGTRRLAAACEPMERGHQERLGGLVRQVMAEAAGQGFAFEDMERIGVTVGPGSFTGLRVGLAFSLGLGTALGRPVVGLSTLAALAASVRPPNGRGLTAALIDARRGQVYAQLFDGREPLSPAAALDLDEAQATIAARHSGGEIILVGSGAALLAPAFPQADLRPLVAPSSEALADLARAADPATATPRPLYLRAPDATPPIRPPGQARTSSVGT